LSQVADNTGKMIEVADLSIRSDRIYSFVTRLRQDYFGDEWSLQRCCEQIVDRGMAEIERQVKTGKKLAQDRAFGELAKLGISAAQAKEMVRAALEAKKQNGQAKA
jgi:hypothetical protein